MKPKKPKKPEYDEEFIRELVEDALEASADYGYASALGTVSVTLEHAFAQSADKLYNALELKPGAARRVVEWVKELSKGP